MKKLLLLAALAASFTSAYADAFSDVFTLSYNDQPVANGETIVVDNYLNEWYDPQYPDDPANWAALAQIKATNKSDSSTELSFILTVESPTEDAFFDKKNKYGTLQVCYTPESGTGNCFGGATKNHPYISKSIGKVFPGSYVLFDIDQKGFENMDPVTLKFELNFDDESSVVYIKFNHLKDITMGVNDIVAESAPTEYYNLQGVRVSEPQKGNLYIVRSGKKVSKRLF